MNWKTHEALVVDVETTSKYPTQEAIDADRKAPRNAQPARVIQFGTCLVTHDNGVINARSGNVWINPGVEVPAEVVEAIHLTDGELQAIRKAPPFSHYCRRIYDSMRRRKIVIGYNIMDYDGPVIDREMCICGLIEDGLHVRFPDSPMAEVIDVLILCRHLLIDAGLPDYRLGTVAEYFGISAEGSHRAGADCMMTWQILQAIKDHLPDDLDALLDQQALWQEFGSFWALRLDGSLALNCTSKKNPALKRGMTPEEVINLDNGFYGWTYKMVGDRARQMLPAF